MIYLRQPRDPGLRTRGRDANTPRFLKVAPSAQIDRDDGDIDYLVERRLCDYLADHDAPVDEIEQAALRARIRRDMQGEGGSE